MKRHRRIESWLADICKELDHPALKGSSSDLYALGLGLTVFGGQLMGDVEKVRGLIAVLRRLRDGRGVGRGAFEEEVMRHLSWLVHHACSTLLDGKMARQSLIAIPDSLDPKLRTACEFVVELCVYAMDCLNYSRPRDSLAGNRRRYALEILGEASCVFDMPESVLSFVRQALKTGRQPVAIGAIQFCELYYETMDMPVPGDIENLLLALAERTTSRGLATGALNVLVESGNISEFTALDCIDDWKERNYYGRPQLEEK